MLNEKLPLLHPPLQGVLVLAKLWLLVVTHMSPCPTPPLLLLTVSSLHRLSARTSGVRWEY